MSTLVGWICLLGCPILLLLGALLNWRLNGWLGGAGLVAFVSGFAILVAQMRDGEPTLDDPDDGAVV